MKPLVPSTLKFGEIRLYFAICINVYYDYVIHVQHFVQCVSFIFYFIFLNSFLGRYSLLWCKMRLDIQSQIFHMNLLWDRMKYQAFFVAITTLCVFCCCCCCCCCWWWWWWWRFSCLKLLLFGIFPSFSNTVCSKCMY